MYSFTRLRKKSDQYKNITKACYHILCNEDIAKDTRDYLNKRVPLECWEQYGFGYFPRDSELNILLKLIDRKTLYNAGLIYPKRPIGILGHFRDHNLLMPFHDVHGNIISLLGRSLLNDDEREELSLQKYKYSKGARKSLYVYGLDKAKDSIIESNSVICIEGQFDSISCRGFGINNVVALGGSDMSMYQFFQIRRYTNNIIIMMDNDDAGEKALNKIRDKYKLLGNIRFAKPPEGYKDIDEFFRNEKDDDWKGVVVEKLRAL